MTERHLPSASPHAAHDPTLIAALAARTPDLTDAQTSTAHDLLASCDACTTLLADLVALQTALPTTSTPARPRDFSLTPADAARLSPGGWRRFLGLVGSARDNVTRPLAFGFTSLGVAGLLLAGLSTFSFGGATQMLAPVGGPVEMAAPAASAAPSASGAPLAGGAAASEPASAESASAAPSVGSAGQAYGTDRMSGSIAPAASDDADGGVFSGSGDIAGEGSLMALRDDASGLSVMFVVAGTLLLVGLGLFALRWSARRLL
jgi:hypothetical protein